MLKPATADPPIRESAIKTISILGSGWLGLPLAAHFATQGIGVKASTRTADRFPEIQAAGAEPFLVDIGDPKSDVDAFLTSDILIVNITAKVLEDYRRLVDQVERCGPSRVLFVGSTSIYRDDTPVVTEDQGLESPDSPLNAIEGLFRASTRFETTVVRFGGLIGYTRQPGRFFSTGRQVTQPEAPVNLIHRDDCLGILDRIVARGVWGEDFNACADTHPSKRAFYTYAAESIGLPAPEFVGHDGQANKVIDNTKVKFRLDYDFLHGDLMGIPFG